MEVKEDNEIKRVVTEYVSIIESHALGESGFGSHNFNCIL